MNASSCGFKSRHPHQNENPFSKEGGFSFCIIYFSLFTIHHSLNRIFVMNGEAALLMNNEK